MLKTYLYVLEFTPENVQYYKFENGNRKLTRALGNDWSEAVFVNKFIVAQPIFAVKIIRNDLGNAIMIGVDFDSAHYTSALHSVAWCIFTSGQNQYAKGVVYQGKPTQPMKVNQIVTVKVDLVNKAISYEVDGVSSGPPRALGLSDEDMKKLRGVVQIHYKDESVEQVSELPYFPPRGFCMKFDKILRSHKSMSIQGRRQGFIYHPNPPQ